MGIKQRNTEIEYLFEKYSEPLSLITWVLDDYQKFEYPNEYLKTGLKWLIKNHPHDSICGCSIDQVHDEMKTRFDWAEQIGNEIIKLSYMYLANLIKFKPHEKNRIPLIIFNPLPWRRKDIVNFNGISKIKKTHKGFSHKFKLIDSNNIEIEYQGIKTVENPRFIRETDISYQFSFLADVPPCGFKVYYVILGEGTKEISSTDDDFKLTNNTIENEFYKIQITNDGRISVYDKKSKISYEDICQVEDVGDWGDEYDFSEPYKNQSGLKFSTRDANLVKISPFLNGTSHKTLKIEMNLMLPVSLTKDRLIREENYIENKIDLYISLYKEINRIDFKIDLENTSKDHRIRVLFPSKIESDKVYSDGHFYVIPRDIKLPDGKRWMQKPLPTNHQKDFIAVNDETKTFTILNRGLPEYEAIKNDNNTITLAVTLLRSNEWLSRSKMASRKFNAGPSLNTPGAQCLGRHTFNLSLIVENDDSNWLDANIHLKGKEFNCPLKPFFPLMLKSSLGCTDRLMLEGFGMLPILKRPRVNTVEPYLPPEFSFLEINNENIILSALKKSEEGNHLIVRVYNIAPTSQRAVLKFFKKISIKKASIVNLLEENPRNDIKAQIEKVNNNDIEIAIEPHVIVTFKIELKSK
jgi:mannosylglycerate hydrolase